MAITIGSSLAWAATAQASPANNQSTTELCKDADYHRLHHLLCDGEPFSIYPPSGVGHGGGGHLLGGLLGL